MPLDMANSGAALVPGAPMPTGTLRQVRVLRAFAFGGQVLAVGDECALPALFAAEMVAAGKAERLAVVAAPPAAAAPAEPVKAARASKSAKG